MTHLAQGCGARGSSEYAYTVGVDRVDIHQCNQAAPVIDPSNAAVRVRVSRQLMPLTRQLGYEKGIHFHLHDSFPTINALSEAAKAVNYRSTNSHRRTELRTTRGMSRCWTCRKRRLKCDGAVPHCKKCWGHGVVCLGYQKPLTWVDGVARRGPMKNRNFGDLQRQPLSEDPLTQGTALVATRPQHLLGGALTTITLTEPLFQDLDHTSRFFVDYCEHSSCLASGNHLLMSLRSHNGCALLSSSMTARTILTAVSLPAPARR